jgi:hypothetical protein
MPDEQQLLGLIAAHDQGVLAAVTHGGYPHLTNVLYVWDPEESMARVSTTADRVKSRILQRDKRAALHVAVCISGRMPLRSVTPRHRKSPPPQVTRYVRSCSP